MKFLVICDTHSINLNKLYYRNLQNIDACFALGDVNISNLRILKEIFQDKVYGILGNHDCFHYLDEVGIENINGKYLDLNNIRFYGFQGSWRYKPGDFPLVTDEESIEFLKNVEYVDVLLSHDSFKGIDNGNWAHPGLEGIDNYIKNIKPKFNIHGHYHFNKIQEYYDTKIITVYPAAIIEIDENDCSLVKYNVINEESFYNGLVYYGDDTIK